jgi:PAS domain S-box-containing protein
VRKDGKTIWLSTSGVPVLDEEGNLLGYMGADIDITERKKAEESPY